MRALSLLYRLSLPQEKKLDPLRPSGLLEAPIQNQLGIWARLYEIDRITSDSKDGITNKEY